MVDNTGDKMPDIARSDPDESAEGQAGHADPGEVFRENPPDDEEVKEIEEERERRLDPENRPDGAEVDNTGENMPDFLKQDQAGPDPGSRHAGGPEGPGASVRP